MKTGWLKDNNQWYYLKSSGIMAKSEILTISGKKYYFNASGVYKSVNQIKRRGGNSLPLLALYKATTS